MDRYLEEKVIKNTEFMYVTEDGKISVGEAFQPIWAIYMLEYNSILFEYWATNDYIAAQILN